MVAGTTLCYQAKKAIQLLLSSQESNSAAADAINFLRTGTSSSCREVKALTLGCLAQTSGSYSCAAGEALASHHHLCSLRHDAADAGRDQRRSSGESCDCRSSPTPAAPEGVFLTKGGVHVSTCSDHTMSEYHSIIIPTS